MSFYYDEACRLAKQELTLEACCNQLEGATRLYALDVDPELYEIAFLTPTIAQEGVVDFLRATGDALVKLIEGLITRLKELFKALWRWVTGAEKKVEKEKEAVNDVARGKPMQSEVPGDEVGPGEKASTRAGDIDTLMARVDVPAVIAAEVKRHEEMAETYIKEVTRLIESDDSVDGIRTKLEVAREEYNLKAAESPAVKSARIMSQTKLPNGGVRTVRLLHVMGKSALMAMTETDKDGKVISHRQFKGDTPKELIAKRHTEFEAARPKELMTVLEAYSKALNDIKAMEKRKTSSLVSNYSRQLRGMVNNLRGKVDKGEVTEAQVQALMGEISQITRVINQLDGASRTLSEAQAAAVTQGLEIITRLRKNLRED